LRDPTFSRFGTVPARDRRTDRQTHDDSIYRASLASRGKNVVKLYCATFYSKEAIMLKAAAA